MIYYFYNKKQDIKSLINAESYLFWYASASVIWQTRLISLINNKTWILFVSPELPLANQPLTAGPGLSAMAQNPTKLIEHVS